MIFIQLVVNKMIRNYRIKTSLDSQKKTFCILLGILKNIQST